MALVVLSIATLGVVVLGMLVVTVLDRETRLVGRIDRPDLAPPRAVWGGHPDHAPGRYAGARALALWARLVRGGGGRVEGQSVGWTRMARGLELAALATGIGLLPVLVTPFEADTSAPVAIETSDGLLALGLVVFFVAFARSARGLAQATPWSRLAAARQSSRAIAGAAVLVLSLAPVAITAGSLDLHEIVSTQTAAIWRAETLVGVLGAARAEALTDWPVPAWNLWVQPLTAALAALSFALWVATPSVEDPGSAGVGVVGIGFDADPIEAWWSWAESALARVFAAGAFTALFLGAGSIPLMDGARFVAGLSPYFGEVVPRGVHGALEVGAFAVKMLGVLVVGSRAGRRLAMGRDDRFLRLATRRLLPLAWANLLLVAALSLLAREIASGGAS